MANTFTGLYPTIYAALDKISRELTGMIPSAGKNTDILEAALGQTISWPVVAQGSAGNLTPAAYGPSPSDITVAAPTFTLNKMRDYSFYLTGEELKGLKSGSNDQVIVQNEFLQAFRTLTNEIELALWQAAYQGASRAYGTAGTAPFGTAADFSDFANVHKILKDNGAPAANQHLVIDTRTGLNLFGKQTVLFKVNESGDTNFLRNGTLGQVEGTNLHESGQIVAVTKGTGASYVLNGAHAIGATSIVMKTGSGTVLAGDTIVLAGDTNKYVVTAGIAAPGTATIGGPGLLAAHSDSDTVTVGANNTPLVAFDGDAVQLGARIPAFPPMGDAADDVIVIQDPVTGLPFQIAMYKQYRRVAYDIAILWGVAAVKSNHIAILLS